MYASIQAKNFQDFRVRIFAKPVSKNNECSIYRIVESSGNSGVDLHNTTRRTVTGKFMELAIRNDGILFVYHNTKLLLEIGPCSLVLDD